MNNKLILNKEKVNIIRENANGKGFYNTCALHKTTYLISKNNRFYCDKIEGKVTYIFEVTFQLKDNIKEFDKLYGTRIEYGQEEWEAINKAMREARHLWLDLKGEF